MSVGTHGRSIAQVIRDAACLLAGAGIDNPRLEARLLLGHATGRTSEDLIRDLSTPAGPSNFDTLVARRAAREPLGVHFGLAGVLVAALSRLPRDADSAAGKRNAGGGGAGTASRPGGPGRYSRPRHPEPAACCSPVCTSGRWRQGSIDRTEAAARLARRNASDLGLACRSAFVVGDWTEPLSGRFDLVLSNPPYIATRDLGGLMPEVRSHEPRDALDGGPACGLAAYRIIIPELPRLLSPSGAAILELGEGQADAVRPIAAAVGLRDTLRRDLSGRVRAMILHPSP